MVIYIAKACISMESYMDSKYSFTRMEIKNAKSTMNTVKNTVCKQTMMKWET